MYMHIFYVYVYVNVAACVWNQLVKKDNIYAAWHHVRATPFANGIILTKVFSDFVDPLPS